jgi:hypothetical protein
MNNLNARTSIEGKVQLTGGLGYVNVVARVVTVTVVVEVMQLSAACVLVPPTS